MHISFILSVIFVNLSFFKRRITSRRQSGGESLKPMNPMDQWIICGINTVSAHCQLAGNIPEIVLHDMQDLIY